MKKIVFSGMLGNALEWYDYALYAQFSGIIAQQFFPNSEIKELLTFAVFAAGFIVRPVGGLVIGFIGDKFGRKVALAIGILTMAFPTAAIGFLPSYNSIGIAAPIILTILRLIQGFSLGGEFSGCIAYIVEHAPFSRRGIAGSASFISMCLGMLLGHFTAQLFAYFMSEEKLFDWGWRIPFIFGFFIGLIGFYIRIYLSESPLYKAAQKSGGLSKSPLKEIIFSYSKELITAIGIYTSVTAPFYIATVFMDNLLHNIGYSDSQAALANQIILITMIIILPVSAHISDKIGRRPIMLTSISIMIILLYPIFFIITNLEYNFSLIAIMLFAALNAVYMGPVPTILVELFPTNVRFTGIALSYNLAAAVFGGTAPMVACSLKKITGNFYSLSYYLIILSITSFMIIFYLYKETYRKTLS